MWIQLLLIFLMVIVPSTVYSIYNILSFFHWSDPKTGPRVKNGSMLPHVRYPSHQKISAYLEVSWVMGVSLSNHPAGFSRTNTIQRAGGTTIYGTPHFWTRLIVSGKENHTTENHQLIQKLIEFMKNDRWNNPMSAPLILLAFPPWFHYSPGSVRQILRFRRRLEWGWAVVVVVVVVAAIQSQDS